ncbi:MAG TPA: hypothetical protein PKE17_11630 [Saprospiraceae bacterium]|nr:hypothetical protein [Saprospiraceae bacterium]
MLVGRAGWPLRRLRVFFVWRLYAAALVGQYEPLIRQDYAAMLRRWAEVYCLEGLWKE